MWCTAIGYDGGEWDNGVDGGGNVYTRRSRHLQPPSLHGEVAIHNSTYILLAIYKKCVIYSSCYLYIPERTNVLIRNFVYMVRAVVAAMDGPCV
jgi:hypothetical protein